ncbi:hypothetical protein ACN28S_38310 [Cystobacter fuscus]
MTTVPFPDRARVDAREKVMGRTAYAADVPLPGLLYAMTVPARIAKGQLTALSLEAAARVPGVVRILTADDFPPPPQGGGCPCRRPSSARSPIVASPWRWSSPRRWRPRSRAPRRCARPMPTRPSAR